MKQLWKDGPWICIWPWTYCRCNRIYYFFLYQKFTDFTNLELRRSDFVIILKQFVELYFFPVHCITRRVLYWCIAFELLAMRNIFLHGQTTVSRNTRKTADTLKSGLIDWALLLFLKFYASVTLLFFQQSWNYFLIFIITL